MARSSAYWIRELAKRTARTVVALDELRAALKRDKRAGRLPFGLKFKISRATAKRDYEAYDRAIALERANQEARAKRSRGYIDAIKSATVKRARLKR